MVWPPGPEPVTRHRGLPNTLAFAALLGHPEAFLAPQPLAPLSVDVPALLKQMLVRSAVPPPRPLAREGPQLRSQRQVILGHLRHVALGGAVLTGQTARPTLRETEPLLKSQDGTAPPGRAQKFPADSSLSP